MKIPGSFSISNTNLMQFLKFRLLCLAGTTEILKVNCAQECRIDEICDCRQFSLLVLNEFERNT